MSGKKRITVSLPIVADGKAIEVPEETVRQIVQGAIVTELTKRPEALEAVVTAVLKEKSDAYSSKTIFTELFEAKVREVAKAVFTEWIDTKRDAIKVALSKRLETDKVGLVDTVVNQIVDSLGSAFRVDISLKIRD